MRHSSDFGPAGEIVAQACDRLTPGGKLVYGTCSICPEENWMQVETLCRTHHLIVTGEPLVIYPTYGGPDAFFGVVLQRA